jgi:UDP-N-acetylglucosamine--N-acetylmuramyl-(pentapeptide) pyrophosphoryl-undecaprenol N-acetylglucosamine transferase
VRRSARQISRSHGGRWRLGAGGRRNRLILVPYPLATADHQAKNARYFQTAGGAILVPEGELGRVPEVVRSLLGDSRRLEEMSTAMRRVSRPDAAEEIAEELIGLASARG